MASWSSFRESDEFLSAMIIRECASWESFACWRARSTCDAPKAANPTSNHATPLWVAQATKLRGLGRLERKQIATSAMLSTICPTMARRRNVVSMWSSPITSPTRFGRRCSSQLASVATDETRSPRGSRRPKQQPRGGSRRARLSSDSGGRRRARRRPDRGGPGERRSSHAGECKPRERPHRRGRPCSRVRSGCSSRFGLFRPHLALATIPTAAPRRPKERRPPPPR